MHQVGVIKTNFNLGWMHVHVIFFVGHSNKQKDDRESVRFQKAAIGLFYCVRDKFIADESAV